MKLAEKVTLLANSLGLGTLVEADLSIIFDEDFDAFLEPAVTKITLSLEERRRSTSTGSQPWGNIPGLPTGREDKGTIRKWVEKHIMPIVKKDKKYYERNIKKVANSVKGGKAITDVKKVDSISDKIKRGKSLDIITDILRGTVLVKTPEDLEKVRKMMKKTFIIYKVKEKEFGSDPQFGYYGSVHYLVEMPSGQIAEIQVMTRDLWNQKHAAHTIYTQNRNKIADDPSHAKSKEFQKQKATSKKLFRRGAGNKKVQIHYGPNITSS